MYLSETVTIRVSKNLKNELSVLRRRKVAEHMDRVMAKTSGKDIHMARDVIGWRKKH